MIKFSCPEEEEAHGLKYTGRHVSVIKLSDGRYAVYDRLYYWRGVRVGTDLVDLLETVIDNPPLNPDERWRQQKRASAILTLKELGLE